MPLSSTNTQPGNIVKSADIIQFFNLFTGAMTDQAVSLKNQVTVGGNQGTSTPAFTINGVAAQTADYLDITASGGAVGGIFKIPSSGVLTLGSGLTITSGGETIQAGGLTVTAGGITVNGGGLTVASGNVDVTTATTVKGVPQQNLLVNPGFEISQRGTVFNSNVYTADRWLLNIGAGWSGGITTLSTTQVDSNSQYSVQIVMSVLGSGTPGLRQKVENWAQLKGITVTASVRVWQATANALRIDLNDGVTTTSSATSATISSWVTLTASKAISASATDFSFTVAQVVASASANYADNATLVVGSVPMDYLPLTPADDLARCLRYYQRIGSGLGAGSPVAPGQAYSTTQAIFMFPLKVPFGGAPTLTVSAIADWELTGAGFTLTALTALTIYASGLGQAVSLNTTIGAANLVGGNATLLANVSSSSWLALEWNP